METCVLYVPEGSKEKYQQAEGWKEFKNIVEMDESEEKTVSIKIGAAGKTTYCGDKALDFSGTDDVKAFVATGYDKGNDPAVIWLTRVQKVPAGVPVLVKGEANEAYEVPVYDGEDAYYENMFKGNTSGEKLTILANETDEDGTKYDNYYLKDGQFVLVNGTATIGNNKSYLRLPAKYKAKMRP